MIGTPTVFISMGKAKPFQLTILLIARTLTGPFSFFTSEGLHFLIMISHCVSGFLHQADDFFVLARTRYPK